MLKTARLQKCTLKYELYIEYLSYVEDILDNQTVQSMAQFPHHGKTNTLEHSMNVSYYTFLLCKSQGLDARAGARAGLLHDLFLYDWHKKTDPKLVHTFNHPKIALENAEKLFEISDVEREMILMHMYPMVEGAKKPKYAETYAIAAVDKLCAITETMKVLPMITERRFIKIALGEAVYAGMIPARVK